MTGPYAARRTRRRATALLLGAVLGTPLATPPLAAAAATARCQGVRATIVAVHRGAHVSGTPHRDVIVARGAGSVVDARGGNDLVCVSGHAYGGAGDDVLVGSARRDVLDGGPGRDTLRGLGGDDLLRGGSGGDRLLGGPGRDRLLGGSGNDRLDGGPGSDVLDGRPGRDVVLRGRGDTVLPVRRPHPPVRPTPKPSPRPTPPPTAPPAPPAPPAPTDIETPPPVPDPVPTGAVRKGVRWVPVGPASPSAPTQPAGAYATLEGGCASARADVAPRMDNEGLSPEHQAFWFAAADVCTALKTGDDAAWTQAAADWGAGLGSTWAPAGCYEQAVAATMTAVLDAAGPSFDRSLVELLPPEPGTTACDPQLSLAPAQGAAGDAVVVSHSPDFDWLFVESDTQLLVGGVAAEWSFDGTTALLTVPPGDPGPVPVVLARGGGEVLPVGTFTRVA
ncbi:hemolysin type calcium-binding protein [Motilibacter peucedani]|uniref:Hemolysin type calcium-binding protein n=1 Tax=Motilibacter peucedani TaxID=598650 RepID=A0A420XSI5_9ACTN|nr:calcium-binding protein [Motilibacter peucedani]RKS77790.1 hemolysin type calcium-binding protein [Motilibacter peucedani]